VKRERAGTDMDTDISIGMEVVANSSAAGVVAGVFEGAAELATLECV
jgi:hypothetical protein